MAKEKKNKPKKTSGKKKLKFSDNPFGKKRVPRLRKFYDEVVVKELKKKYDYNFMKLPKLEKIVVNMGLGKSINESKILEAATKDLSVITGQKPQVRKAKKAISNFKLRKGMPVGISVCLRRNRMYEFFDRLINIATPRIRDFRGYNVNGFDGRGNYNFGITEQIVFPEIEYDKVQSILGMNITMVTSAENDEEAKTMLELMGVPFKKTGIN